MKIEIIHLKNEDITKELIDRAQFIFWAAGGSLGDSGAFRIITDDGKSYYCNYVYGDADINHIVETCPLIHEDSPNNGAWDGWVFHDLGGGNFLLFRKEYAERYNELLDDNDEVAYEYWHWHRTALKVLGNPDAFAEDYEEPSVDELRETEDPEDMTIFVAWTEGGSGLAGMADEDSENGVLYFNFEEGVGIEAFYPVSRLMNTEGWIHQNVGDDSHILVNTKYADIFIKIYKGKEMMSWLRGN